MFFLIILPLGLFVLGTILLIIDLRKDKLEGFFDYLGGLFFCCCIIWIIMLIISGMVATTPAKAIYADIENPVYLYQVPESQSKYLLLNENLKQGGKYTYFFTNKDGVPDSDTIYGQQARLVFDNPERPYYAPIKHECSIPTFWFLWCSNSSPYTKEFHLPENSVLKLITQEP